MNDNRFTRIVCSNDEYTGSLYEWDEPVKIDKICDKLNQFDKRLKDKDALLQKQLAISQNLNKQLAEKEKEIHNIKRTLDDMIDNERTHLGHNALSQFREAIQ